MLRHSIVLAALLLPGSTALPAETITSDTLIYCDGLAARMAQRPLPPDAQSLLLEGRAMCQRGQVAGGLRRLRLAMLIVRGAASP